MQVLPRVLVAAGVSWLAHMIEESLTATAWGGPFTIFFGWILIVWISFFYAIAAVLVGQLLRLPAIRHRWARAGYWTLFMAIPPTLILAFSSSLGLRTTDPVSNCSLMLFWPSFLCHFFIVFPVANLPNKAFADLVSFLLQL